jgi:hypothetical protein
MNVSEKIPKHLDVQTLSTQQTTPRTRFKPAGSILRMAIPIAVAVALLTITGGPQAFAKTAPQADSTAAPAIDPDAMAALNSMGTYLRTLKAFQVTTAGTTDNVLDDGQAIQSSSTVDLIAVRPNRLRAEITGEDKHEILFFDGKNFTIYGQLNNFYATVPAPPTIGELVDQLSDKYGIELPLVDIFEWGTNEAATKRITSAVDIGPATIDDITCEHYAFRQKGIDWEIWIQLGDFPLPRKYVIRTLTDDARPQHSVTLDWNLAPSYSDDAFTFDPPPGALSIPIQTVDDNSTEKAK